MAAQRKYSKTKGWWPYVIKTPNDMYYVGYSGGKDGTKQPSQRWQPLHYKNTELQPYIEKFGWENLEKVVLIDGLTENEVKDWEDSLICMYQQLGCCINKHRSGGNRWCNGSAEVKQYNKYYHEKNFEKYRNINNERCKKWRTKHKKEMKQWRTTFYDKPENKIYNRVNAYNYYNVNHLITPSEAKEMYLLTGYIPDFIKSDDIIDEKNYV